MKSLLEKLSQARENLRTKQATPRERVMLLGLIGVALFIWLMSLTNNYRQLKTENDAATHAIAQNEIVLGTRDLVQRRLAEKARELDKSAEVSGTDLLSIIGALGAETQLKPESSRPTNKSQAPFDIISVRITLRNASLENLIEFDERISNEYPSVAVTEARFTPTSDDGMTLTASYEITSFLLQSSASNKLR